MASSNLTQRHLMTTATLLPSLLTQASHVNSLGFGGELEQSQFFFSAGSLTQLLRLSVLAPVGFQQPMARQPFLSSHCPYTPYPYILSLAFTPPTGCFTSGDRDFRHANHFFLSTNIPFTSRFIRYPSSNLFITATATAKLYKFQHCRILIRLS